MTVREQPGHVRRVRVGSHLNPVVKDMRCVHAARQQPYSTRIAKLQVAEV